MNDSYSAIASILSTPTVSPYCEGLYVTIFYSDAKQQSFGYLSRSLHNLVGRRLFEEEAPCLISPLTGSDTGNRTPVS